MTADAPAPRVRWLPFVVVAVVWMAVATRQMALPGVYMDAVNPDYLVVRLLNPHAEPIAAWLLGGNYVHGKAPVLISLYHGSQQVWLGLPFFALFGTTVTGLRLTHAMFALGVLAALYALLVRGGVKPWQAALAGAALAVDPAFSYAFRTQSYITVAPAMWLFLSLYAMLRATAAASPRRWLAAAGVAHGLAIVGYFIYAFYLPAILLALALFRRERGRAQPATSVAAWATPWAGGLALGAIFYPIGYALMIRAAGGWAEAWEQFQATQRALGAFSAQLPLAGRLAHIGTMIGTVIGNSFHHQLIFGEHAELPGAEAKAWLLLALPAAMWLAAELRGRATTLLRVLVALPVSFAAVAMVFGSRLQGHHFVPLLPVFYAALAAALFGPAGARPRSARAAAVLVLAALLALNLRGQAVEGARLAEVRGVGLYSDAINRLALDLDARARKPFVVFPDWGLSMPIAFLTHGDVGMDSVVDLPALRRTLCDGRDVAFAVVTGDRAARIKAWQAQLNWDAPAVTPYAQGDGKVVFELATFAGRPDTSAPACPPR